MRLARWCEYFEGTLDPAAAQADELVASVHRLMLPRGPGAAAAGAGERRHRRGRRAGAAVRRGGHRVVPHRAHVPRRAPPARRAADPGRGRRAARRRRWRRCFRCSGGTSCRSSPRWTGCPPRSGCWTRRCTSSCPNITELSVRVALAEARGEKNENDLRLHAGRAPPARAEPDARAARGPARARRAGPVRPAGPGDRRGHRPADQAGQRPAAGDHDPAGRGRCRSSRSSETDAKKVLAEVAAETGVELTTPLGTMIELPRAAMTAGQIAEVAEFFSFGTNDLTQTTWGFSRDDVEAAFFSTYLEMGIFGISPFETLDVEGVGELVRIGTERGPGHPPGPQGRRVRRARRRPRLGALLPPRSGWTTCPAHRSASPSPGSKPVGSRSRPQPVQTAADGAMPQPDPVEPNEHDNNRVRIQQPSDTRSELTSQGRPFMPPSARSPVPLVRGGRGRTGPSGGATRVDGQQREAGR